MKTAFAKAADRMLRLLGLPENAAGACVAPECWNKRLGNWLCTRCCFDCYGYEYCTGPRFC